MAILFSIESGISVTGWLYVAFLFILIAFLIERKRKTNYVKKYNLPPGPKGIPLLGTFPSFLTAPAHTVFECWTKDFGNVFKFTLGSGTTVVLGDVTTVREAFLHKAPDVDNRCQWRYCFIHMFKGLSVLPYSLKWQNTRRKTLTILRNFGMGKSFMEEKIYEETICLMKCMLDAGKHGKNFSPRDMIRRTPTNILCSILFGKRYDYNHPGLLYILNTISWLVNFLAKASIYDILPNWLRQITGFSLNNYHKNVAALNKFLKGKVNEHKQTYLKQQPTNFIDAWLTTLDEDKQGNSRLGSCRLSGGHLPAHDRVVSDLPDVLQDLMIAGSHSTGIVFIWCILLLVLNKDVQDKAYDDIMETIGSNRAPSMSDRPKLPYIEAIINEVMRIATVLPLVAHATGRDTTIGGYDVPANMEVIYNNWMLNRDEKVYPEPNVFKPGRWLNHEGQLRKDLLHGFFPFGLGKRSCAGEALARMHLFITVTTLLQNVEFLTPDESVPDSLKPEVVHEFGLLADCKPFMLRVRRRPCVPAA